jgi:hypothetical protein
VTETDTDDYVAGDLEDEGGARLTDMLAEQTLVGMLIVQPDLASDVRDLVSPREFFDRALGRVFEGLLGADGFRPENSQIIEWLGGPTVSIADAAGEHRAGGQLIGYLVSLGMEKERGEASVLADRIFEVAERRFTEEGQTNLVGLDAWQSKMGAVLFEEREEFDAQQYDDLVEDVIPERELIIVMGPSQAGKSFVTYHMAMCIARAVPFFGRRISEPAPVIWCAYEGGRGSKGRMRAYANYFDIKNAVPFAALTSPFDLWSNEANVEALIKEVDALCALRFNGKKPGAVIIDTHNAATPGASEIDSGDVSKIRDRYKAIMRALECSVIVIGHTNALGKHRGNEQLYNNAETVCSVYKKTRVENRQTIPVKDNDGREVRVFEIVKQREGITGVVSDFVLHGVDTGIKNKFGKPRMSCVVTEPNWSQEPEKGEEKKADTKGGFKLTDIEDLFFDVLWKQLHEAGSEAPPELHLPRGTKVVHRSIVSAAYRRSSIPQDGSQAASDNTIKSRWDRSARKLRKFNVIGFSEPYFWWTGKPVLGKPATQTQRSFLDDMDDPGPPPSDYEFPE